jgi:hypothetical protein
VSTYVDDTLNESFDWDLLVTSRLNAILCGDRPTLDVNLRLLRAHLELPLHEWSCVGEPSLPSIANGTLIVTDLVGATLDQQRAFLEWLDAHDAVRVVSVSERPVFDLVARGLLLEQLYYRLNPVYCTLSPNARPGSTRPGHSSAA